MIIRPVEPRDYEQWRRMRDALWPGIPKAEHEEEMARYIGHPSMAAFVADVGHGRLGGFLEAGTRPHADGCATSPVGYVEGWYVDSDLRQRGVGRALVEAAEAWARSRGCSEMASDCLLDNGVSFQAHLCLGYQEVERLIHFRKSLKG